MSWLGDVLKHVTISGAVTGAVLAASVVLLLGPAVYPDLIDPVPAEFRWLVVGAGVFCAALLLLWAVPPVFRFIASIPTRIAHSPSVNPPRGREWELLVMLARNYPTEIVWVDNFDFSQIPKLEILELCRALREKGLLRDVGGDPDCIVVTEMGRRLVRKRASK